ncbi:hypothetical protein LWC34_17190 [Kibdelosporangium philippinense]|uniref:Uncharacterized protein n=1 Tax=Kibdelosporangium philippinense TaxID=211113 RepID=A0ABS8ZDF3_9PSEU|nr:hypothetical protein [Kibdelosporangium philippinense]MCE7004548.1 hypothetical protein [Kibdelosporangium philippinense]
MDRGSLVEHPDALLTRARQLIGQHMVALAYATRGAAVSSDEPLRQAEAIAAVRARLDDDVIQRTAGALVHAINAVPGGWPQLRQLIDGA